MKTDKRIEDTLDAFLEDLEQGIPYAIRDEVLLRKTFFEREKFINKRWKNPRKCLYPGCRNKSIKRSHTISKSSSLKMIAENSFVLTPSFSNYSGEMEMLKIGIGVASTFPGLCEEHETIYESYENRGFFNDSSEVNLQIFRSVLREKFRLELESENLEKILKTTDKLLADEFCQRIRERYGNRTPPKIEKVKTNFPQKEYLKEFLDELLESLNEIDEIFYEDFENQVKSIAVQIDIDIPVCLSGMTSQRNNDKEYVIIICVIPNMEGTLITASYNKDATFLDKSFDFLKGHPLVTIKFIEDIMVKNSDHWFIKPNVWEQISPKYQEKILNDIMLPRHKLLSEEYSIFNALKKDICKEMLIHNRNPVTIKNLNRELSLIGQFSAG